MQIRNLGSLPKSQYLTGLVPFIPENNTREVFMKICSIDECCGRIVGRGYCVKHYKKLMKYGNPLHKKIQHDYVHGTPREKFYKSFVVNKENNCWEWNASINKQNYGIICIKRKRILAHRFSYELFTGKIKKGMVICHHCDNPRCVNPEHLFMGTHNDNVQDKVKKGRGNYPKGEQKFNAILTKRKVLKIKELIGKGIFCRIIAKMYKVSPTTIFSIKHGKTWKHI